MERTKASSDDFMLDKSSVTVTVALEVPVNVKLTPGIKSVTLFDARFIEPKPFTVIMAFCAELKRLDSVENPKSGLELSEN
jgi:hypothetical protein